MIVDFQVQLIMTGSIVFFITVVRFWQMRTSRGGRDLAFASHGASLSPAERSFLHLLEKQLPADYTLFAKVRLGDIVGKPKGGHFLSLFGRNHLIKKEHVDIVICHADDRSVVGCIVLDKAWRKAVRPRRKDQLFEQILEDAHIPLYRISPRCGSVPKDLLQTLLVKSILQMDAFDPDEASCKYSKWLDPMPAVNPDATTQKPVCPKCGHVLVAKKADVGKFAGKYFWGCSNFPECRYASNRSVLSH